MTGHCPVQGGRCLVLLYRIPHVGLWTPRLKRDVVLVDLRIGTRRVQCVQIFTRLNKVNGTGRK